MEVFLIDGTYELFRHYYALPPAKTLTARSRRGARRRPVGAGNDHRRSTIRRRRHRPCHRIVPQRSVAGLQNRWVSSPRLYAQFTLLEEALAAAGIAVWPMTEFEADDALASAAIAARDARVDRVVICTPDKDLAQCVQGTRVVQTNRRTRTTFDEAGIRAKFGVSPASIRLSRAGGRRRGRLSGSARLGRQVHGGSARAIRAPRGDPDGSRPWSTRRIPARWQRRSHGTWSWRCCSATLPRCARIFRCLTTWRRCGGTVRGPSSWSLQRSSITGRSPLSTSVAPNSGRPLDVVDDDHRGRLVSGHQP